MGTQQVLMLVIGVIVVGVAVAVGIVMFNTGSYNANQNAIAVNMQDINTKMLQFWMLPSSMGGANQLPANVKMETVGASLGFSKNGEVYSFINEDGEFRLKSTNETNGKVVIEGLGNVGKSNNKFPLVTMTIDMMTQSAETAITEASGFSNTSH